MLALVLTVAPRPASAQVFTQISSNSTLKVGSRGAAVSAMQSFLASNGDIYPEGRVTGYFGSLTKNEIKTQITYGTIGNQTNRENEPIRSKTTPIAAEIPKAIWDIFPIFP